MKSQIKLMVDSGAFSAWKRDNQMGVNHRLISYFDLMDEDPDALERYTNGEYKTPAKRITKANWKRQNYLNIRYANLIERMKP